MKLIKSYTSGTNCPFSDHFMVEYSVLLFVLVPLSSRVHYSLPVSSFLTVAFLQALCIPTLYGHKSVSTVCRVFANPFPISYSAQLHGTGAELMSHALRHIQRLVSVVLLPLSASRGSWHSASSIHIECRCKWMARAMSGTSDRTSNMPMSI